MKDLYLPKKIKNIIGKKNFIVDDTGMSGSSVLIFDDMVLKIRSAEEDNSNEQVMMEWLKYKISVPECICNFTENDFATAKRTLISGLKQTYDSPSATEAFGFRRYLAGISAGIEESICKVSAVSRDDIVRVAQGVRPDAGVTQQPSQFRIGVGGVQPQQEVQARILLLDGQFVRKCATLQLRNHLISLDFIGFSQSIYVFFKVPAAQKTLQSILLEARNGAAVEPKPGLKLRHQRLRQNHITDADGGSQGLGEGVHVDHPVTAVHREQSGHRVSIKAEFRIIIVLNDPLLSCFAPIQQL